MLLPPGALSKHRGARFAPPPIPPPWLAPSGAGDAKVGGGEGLERRGEGPRTSGWHPGQTLPLGRGVWPNTPSSTRGGVDEYCALRFLPWEVLVPPSLFWRPLGGLARFGTTIHNPGVPPRLPSAPSPASEGGCGRVARRAAGPVRADLAAGLTSCCQVRLHCCWLMG